VIQGAVQQTLTEPHDAARQNQPVRCPETGTECPPQSLHRPKKERHADGALEQGGGQAPVEPPQALGADARDCAVEGAAEGGGAQFAPPGLGLETGLDGVKRVACRGDWISASSNENGFRRSLLPHATESHEGTWPMEREQTPVESVLSSNFSIKHVTDTVAR
jgi:hypothetical protein